MLTVKDLSLSQTGFSTATCQQPKRGNVSLVGLFVRYFLAGLISIASFIVYSDQQLLNANLSAAAKDLGISEEDKDSALGGIPSV